MINYKLFRQYHECQNGHPRFLFWRPKDGFNNEAYWGDKHPDCKCPTASFDQGFTAQAPHEQSIGINDVNESTIFEGDIFDYNGEKRYVQYIEDRCRYVLTNGKGYDSRNCIDIDCDVLYKSEIIGTIHDK